VTIELEMNFLTSEVVKVESDAILPAAGEIIKKIRQVIVNTEDFK
jgi:hypothetical protein